MNLDFVFFNDVKLMPNASFMLSHYAADQRSYCVFFFPKFFCISEVFLCWI